MVLSTDNVADLDVSNDRHDTIAGLLDENHHTARPRLTVETQLRVAHKVLAISVVPYMQTQYHQRDIMLVMPHLHQTHVARIQVVSTRIACRCLHVSCIGDKMVINAALRRHVSGYKLLVRDNCWWLGGLLVELKLKPRYLV